MDIDPDHAKTYSRYRAALRTERELKPTVRELAVDDLRAGITVAQLAEATGMTPEVFRRIARDNDIPVDARYAERAEKFRARAASAPEPRERPSPQDKRPSPLDRLTGKQLAELVTKAFGKVVKPEHYKAIDAASREDARLAVETALDLGVLDDKDLRLA